MSVAGLVQDREARARLVEATRGRTPVRFCEVVDDLVGLVAAGGVSVAVVEARDRSGRATAPMVRLLRAGFPHLPILAYCDPRRVRAADIVALVRAGADDLIYRGEDDARHALAAVLAGAAGRRAGAQVLDALGAAVPDAVRPVLAYALDHATEPLTVDDLAHGLAIPRRTLASRLARAGVPTPSALITWARLLAAARLLGDPGRSVEQVASQLDFPSATALRNTLKRYTGRTPGEVRADGGARALLAAFTAALTAPCHLPAPGVLRDSGPAPTTTPTTAERSARKTAPMAAQPPEQRPSGEL